MTDRRRRLVGGGPRRRTPEDGRSLERKGLPAAGVRLLFDGSALVKALGGFEVWNLVSGVQERSMELSDACRWPGVLEVLPGDGGLAAGCQEGGFMTFDLEGRVLQRFELSSDAEAYLSEESPGLGSFGSVRHPDGTWEDLSRQFDAYSTPSSIAMDGSGETALVAYGQVYALLWDLRSGTLLQALGEERPGAEARRIYEVALSTDGEIAATRGASDGIVIWHTRDRRKLRGLPVAGPHFSRAVDRPGDTSADPVGRGGTGAMGFVPGSTELVAAEGPVLLRIEARTGEMLGRWVGHGDHHPIMGEHRTMPRIHDVRFSVDGRRALTVGVDSTLRLWDVGSGSQVWAVRPDPCCMDWADLSADGKTVVWAGCPGVKVYSVN